MTPRPPVSRTVEMVLEHAQQWANVSGHAMAILDGITLHTVPHQEDMRDQNLVIEIVRPENNAAA